MRQINQTRTSHNVRKNISGREYTMIEEFTRKRPCYTHISNQYIKTKEGRFLRCSSVQVQKAQSKNLHAKNYTLQTFKTVIRVETISGKEVWVWQFLVQLNTHLHYYLLILSKKTDIPKFHL